MNAEVIKILEQKQVKPTPMRMLILEQLLILNKNVTLSEIEKILYPADRITIYRTLQTFVKYGIAHSTETTNNGVSYALCLGNCTVNVHVDNHPHFYCEICKNITCNNDFEYSFRKISDKNYTINKVELTISGICPSCKN